MLLSLTMVQHPVAPITIAPVLGTGLVVVDPTINPTATLTEELVNQVIHVADAATQ